MRTLIPLLCLTLGGCANLATVYREVGGSPQAGRSIVIDAAQRAVVAVERETSLPKGGTRRQTLVCPEPSPDAIAAFFAAQALTVSRAGADGSSTDARAANNFGSNVAAFGLRTNSTVLLTHALAANCFAHLNGATEDPAYVELQRRGQTFNLGILAIEQLTGVVKGDGASLQTQAGASTGTPDLGALQQALDKARAARDAAISAEAAAQRAWDDSTAAVNRQAALMADAKTRRDAALAAGNTAAGDAAAAELKTAEEALPALRDRETSLAAAHGEASARLVDARAEVARQEQTLRAAQGQASSAGSGVATLRPQPAPGPAAAAVSDAVARIVGMVLAEAGRGEGCNGIFRDFTAHHERYLQEPGQTVLRLCLEDQRANTRSLLKAAGLATP